LNVRIPANFFWDMGVRLLSWECWDFCNLEPRSHSVSRCFTPGRGRSGFEIRIFEDDSIISEDSWRSLKSSEEVWSLPKTSEVFQRRPKSQSQLDLQQVDLMNFRAEFVFRVEFFRPRSGWASNEVARGRPSSGGYWINKTKDFSESISPNLRPRINVNFSIQKSEMARKVLSFIHFTHGFRSLHGSELEYFWKLCQARRQQLTFFNKAWEIGPQAWAGVRSKFSTRRRETHA